MLPLLLSNLVASKPLGPCHSLPCSEPFSGKGEKEKKEDEEVKAPSAEAGRPKDFGMIDEFEEKTWFLRATTMGSRKF